MKQRRELSAFLTACRARLRPEDVGLPRGARRRTAGLRREEVALLSGLSPSWYTFLEQGRSIRISEPMLASVARALRLGKDERAYLYRLALEDPHTAPPRIELDLPTAVVAVLDAHPHPAYAKNTRWDLLHANAAMRRVFGFESSAGINLMRWSFSSEARALFRDWRTNIAREIGLFRADLAAAGADPRASALVAELERTDADFRRLWSRQTVSGRRPGSKRLAHPKLGELDFAYFSAKLPEYPALTLVFFSPLERAR